MFKMWFREFKDNHLLEDIIVERPEEDTRTHKVFNSIDEACTRLDLPRPIWLDKNISEFKRFSKTRFKKDSFIEEIPFDYLEVQIFEED